MSASFSGRLAPALLPGRAWRALAGAVFLTALASSVGWGLASFGGVRSVALVFLPGILYVAVTWGLAIGAATAVVSALIFNFFFLEPFDSFNLKGIEDVLAMAVFMAVALITGSLATRAREHARLAEAERFGSALLGSISHDLRTPLAAILGSATTLLSDAPVQEAARRELLASIRDEALRLDRFVAKLLDMTRLQAGRLRPNRDRVEPAEVIGASLSKFRRRLSRHELIVDAPDGMPLVTLDPILIEHALENLLDNAARHTPPGRRIRVAASVERGIFSVEVEDEGPGIAPADRPHVFDKFFSVEAPGRGGGGTGLGLTICRGFVEAHGGRVEVGESAFGGARFTITLPA